PPTSMRPSAVRILQGPSSTSASRVIFAACAIRRGAVSGPMPDCRCRGYATEPARLIASGALARRSPFRRGLGRAFFRWRGLRLALCAIGSTDGFLQRRHQVDDVRAARFRIAVFALDVEGLALLLTLDQVPQRLDIAVVEIACV